MDYSPRLALPYIAAQQAQKHITFNEAMKALDVLVQPAVISASAGEPPAGPAEGDSYLVPEGATAAWAGHEGEFASWQDGGWSFRAAANGWLVYVADAAEILIRQPAGWMPLVSTGGSSVGMFGINATADGTNRLAVGSDASLFTHDGDDHRLKLNKAAAGDTGSMLFQTGWSGRAELGLCGDDDFHVKVSADGSGWIEALRVAGGTGAVSLGAGQLAFPAVPNPSADANTLDHYAEGTFVPTLSFNGGTAGIAYSTQIGAYTRIGDLVFVEGYVQLAAKGSSTGALRLHELPFAPRMVTSLFGSAGTWVNNLTGTSGGIYHMVRPGETYVEFYFSGAGAMTLVTNVHCNNNTNVIFSFWYKA